MIFNLKKKYSNLLIVAALLVLLFSCSKKDHPANPIDPPVVTTPASSAKQITAVNILKSENSSFTSDGYAFLSGTKIYITLPLNSALNNVKVNFILSDKASVKVNGAALSGGSGFINLSTETSAEVTAEDKSIQTYTILAQTGIKEIDAMIYSFIEKYNIPAASYAVGKNSREDIVYKNASGYAVTETKERAAPDYEFRLASMTKQHTAIAIMRLIQEGKIAIDQLVFGPSGILKDQWPVVGPLSSKVTVQHLLEHTAGYTGDPMFSSSAGATLNEKIQYMLNSAQSEPGTKYYYYNLGYGVLGKIIEKVTGKDYITYLKELYATAGIQVNLASSSPANRRSKEAVCYPQGSSSAYANDMEVYKAAGGVSINTENLFKVLYAVDGGSIKPDILDAPTRTFMFTKSTVANYAKGWRMNHSLFNGYYHGGNLIGTATFWIYGTDYSAAVLLNSRSNEDNFDTDLIVLANNILNKAKELGL